MSDRDMFRSIEEKLRQKVESLNKSAEKNMHQANKKHFLEVRAALDTLRNENAVDEMEQYPDFKRRMQREMNNAQKVLRDIRRAVEAIRVQA